MAADRSDADGREERLYRILQTFLESSDRGLRPDPAELLSGHSEFGPELEEFLDTLQRLDDLTAPVREVSQILVEEARSYPSGGANGGTVGTSTTPGRTVGDYEILGEIGRGGMGVVYKARDRKLGRLVAVKMLRSAGTASPAELARFLAEARAKARLDHPHVVPVHEVGESDGVPYLVMALVEGGSLQARLAGGPLPAGEAARLARQVADAIQHAHGRGVLHRDLKPQNILLHYGEETSPDRAVRGAALAKVSDFGIARLEGQDGLTATGEVLGTPGYMAPEQASGRPGDVGTHSDVYGLGALLYCLLTGRPPFRGATQLETLRLARDRDPVPPRQLNPQVPRDLEAVCLKCLEKKPARRYARAADVAADLQRFLDGKPTRARPLGPAGRAWRRARRQPARAAAAAGAAAGVLALAGGAVAYALQARAHRAELAVARGKEQRQAEKAEARGYLLRRKAYADGIWRAAAAWENLQRQMEDQVSGRPVPDVLAELPRAEDCVLASGGVEEDLRGFEWYYLRRLGSGLRTWRGHQGDVAEVAFSRDGRLALTAGGSDGTARLWDPETGKEVARFRGRGAVDVAALAPDGRFVALAGGTGPGEGSGGNVQVQDRESGARVADLVLGARSINAVACAPDGSALAAIGTMPDGSGALAVWEVGTWRQRFRWRAAAAAPALCFSGDGRSLAEAMPDGSAPPAVRIHDLQTGKQKAIPVGPFADTIMRLAFAPDGRTLASGGLNGRVVLWDVASGTPRRDWDIPQRGISGLSFSPDGKTLAVAAKTPAGVKPGRSAARLWDAGTGQPRSGAWGPGSLIHHLAYAPDGRSVALACGDATVRLWDPDRLEESHVLPGHHNETWSVAFSPDGQTLASCGDNRKVYLWDVGRGRLRAKLIGHLSSLVSGVAFHPGGKILASVDYDGRIRLWDVASGTSLGPPVKGHAVAARCLAFAPDGRTLATGGRDRSIRVWDVGTNADGRPEIRARAELTGHDKDVLALAFSPDGRLLASTSDDRTLRLWDARDGRPVRTIEEPGSVRCVTFAPDGRLAWGTDAGEVKVGAAEGDAPATALAGHAGRVRAVAFSADGRTLTSAGDDRVVHLWQAATGQPLLTLHGHTDAVYAVSFAPDGRSLATACHDGTVRLWPTAPDAPQPAVAAR
jgi:WD40 repeat protein